MESGSLRPTGDELIFAKKTIWQNETRKLKYLLDMLEYAQDCPEIHHQDTISQLKEIFNCQGLGILIFLKNGYKDYCEDDCERIHEQAYLSQVIRLLVNKDFLWIANREAVFYPEESISQSRLDLDWYTGERLEGTVKNAVWEFDRTRDLCLWLLIDVLTSRDLINHPFGGCAERFSRWSNLTKLNLQIFYRLITLGLPDQQDHTFARKLCDKFTSTLIDADRFIRDDREWLEESSKHIQTLAQAFKALDTSMAPRMIDSDKIDENICSCPKTELFCDSNKSISTIYHLFMERRNLFVWRFVERSPNNLVFDFALSIYSLEEEKEFGSYLSRLKRRLKNEYGITVPMKKIFGLKWG